MVSSVHLLCLFYYLSRTNASVSSPSSPSPLPEGPGWLVPCCVGTHTCKLRQTQAFQRSLGKCASQAVGGLRSSLQSKLRPARVSAVPGRRSTPSEFRFVAVPTPPERGNVLGTKSLKEGKCTDPLPETASSNCFSPLEVWLSHTLIHLSGIST